MDDFDKRYASVMIRKAIERGLEEEKEEKKEEKISLIAVCVLMIEFIVLLGLIF